MAIFEYKCPACGEQFEDFASIADRDKPRECAVCGKPGAARVLSLFAAPSGGGSTTGAMPGPCVGGGCSPGGST